MTPDGALPVEKRGTPLVNSWLKRSAVVPWYGWIGLVAAGFGASILLVAYLDRVSLGDVIGGHWRQLATSPTIILFIMVAHHFLAGLEKQSLKAIVQILRQSQKSKDELLQELTTVNLRNQVIAALVGAGIIVALGQPWRTAHTWFDIYLLTSQALMFGILGWLIYTGLHAARNVTRLSRSELDLDLFRLDALAPISRWSLGVSFAFIGGISISLLFQERENLLQWPIMLVYAILVMSAVAIFFVSMRGIHNTILKVKRQELAQARDKLTTAQRKLRELAPAGIGENKSDVYSEVAAWWIYERQVREVREWPYDSGVIRRLAASIISPAIIYLLKLFFGINL